MYLFFGIVLGIIAALALALLIGIVMALREGAGTPKTLMTRDDERRIAAISPSYRSYRAGQPPAVKREAEEDWAR